MASSLFFCCKPFFGGFVYRMRIAPGFIPKMSMPRGTPPPVTLDYPSVPFQNNIYLRRPDFNSGLLFSILHTHCEKIFVFLQ